MIQNKQTKNIPLLSLQDEVELHTRKSKKDASIGMLHPSKRNHTLPLSYMGPSLIAGVFHNLHCLCYKWNLIRWDKKEMYAVIITSRL